MSALATPSTRSFVYPSQVHWDELDPMSILHNARFALHIERAVIAFYSTRGRRWEKNVADNPDQFHAVRDFRIEFVNPVMQPGAMHIEIWVERLGSTSCVYGFQCLSEDGRTLYARGTRAIVKLDPQSYRPSPWTDFFRHGHEEILRGEH